MSEQPLDGRAVLVVEDVALLAWMVESMLTSYGCAVVGPAFRLSQALEMARTQRIDIALLDINLHEATSYPVAEALAARNIPFIFVTAYGREQLPAAYASTPLLRKPYEPGALRRALASVLAEVAQTDRVEPAVTEARGPEARE